jgi:hypothetical protein
VINWQDFSNLSEEVERIVTDTIDLVIGEKQWDESKSGQWINDIIEKVMEELYK